MAEWGEITVTRRCCGAGNCRNFAPELFAEVRPVGAAQRVLADSYEEGAFSGAVRQPASAEDYQAARTAAAGCGFSAIRISKPEQKVPSTARGSVWKAWPKQIEGDVWVLGRPSLRNYGALSYFIERPGGGILIDVPKPNKRLFDWLEAHGGVKWLFLSHADHVQHHAEIVERFPGCQRVIGAADVNKRENPWMDATDACEVQVSGDQPTHLDGTPLPLAQLAEADVAILPQPGHTPGGLCLLYQGRFLFTGDHLAWNADLGHLFAHRLQCWEDWERQTTSIATLARWARAGHLSFAWVLPGHGEWHELDDGSSSATADALEQGVAWMKAQPRGNVPLIRWIPFVQTRAKPDGWFARVVNAIGGRNREAWLLPKAARSYLTDYRASGRTLENRATVNG